MKRVILTGLFLLAAVIIFSGCPANVNGSYIGTWSGTVPSKQFTGDAELELVLSSNTFEGTIKDTGAPLVIKVKGDLKEDGVLLTGTLTHSDYGSGWKAIPASYSHWATFHYAYTVEGNNMKVTGSHLFVGIPYGTYTLTKK